MVDGMGGLAAYHGLGVISDADAALSHEFQIVGAVTHADNLFAPDAEQCADAKQLIALGVGIDDAPHDAPGEFAGSDCQRVGMGVIEAEARLQ